MPTKRDLEKLVIIKQTEVHRLNERVGDLKGDVNSWKGKFENINEIVPQLKHSIAELERNNARLEGYVERINQQDQAAIIADMPEERRNNGQQMHMPMPFNTPTRGQEFTAVDYESGYQRKERKNWYEL